MSKEILQDIIKDFNPDKFVRFFRDKNRTFAPKKEELIQYEGDNYQFTFSQDSFFAEIHYWTDVIMDTCSIIDWTYKINGKYVVSLDSIEFTGIISTVPDNCDTITHIYLLKRPVDQHSRFIRKQSVYHRC